MFGEGEPGGEQQEEAHEQQIDDGGESHFNPEKHHDAQCEFHDGESVCKNHAEKLHEIHVKRVEIVVELVAVRNGVNGFGETGEDEDAAEQDAQNHNDDGLFFLIHCMLICVNCYP